MFLAVLVAFSHFNSAAANPLYRAKLYPVSLGVALVFLFEKANRTLGLKADRQTVGRQQAKL